MSEPAFTVSTDRLALRRSEAADRLGVSAEIFDEHIRPHLRTVRLGRVRVYPVAELIRFLADRADHPLEERT